LKKKLLALPKEKDCDIIQPWMKSIVYHLYWTAASCPDQDWELMLAKLQQYLASAIFSVFIYLQVRHVHSLHKVDCIHCGH
jgi:solute carrier family 8 (sodium/calcium exchanger)